MHVVCISLGSATGRPGGAVGAVGAIGAGGAIGADSKSPCTGRIQEPDDSGERLPADGVEPTRLEARDHRLRDPGMDPERVLRNAEGSAAISDGLAECDLAALDQALAIVRGRPVGHPASIARSAYRRLTCALSPAQGTACLCKEPRARYANDGYGL
jgi:hypothetical protein